MSGAGGLNQIPGIFGVTIQSLALVCSLSSGQHARAHSSGQCPKDNPNVPHARGCLHPLIEVRAGLYPEGQLLPLARDILGLFAISRWAGKSGKSFEHLQCIRKLTETFG